MCEQNYVCYVLDRIEGLNHLAVLPLDRKPIMKIHVEYFVLKSFEHITRDIGLRHKLVA